MRLEITPGYYPGFIEIKGAPFRVSIVVSASDITFADGFNRTRAAERIVEAVNAHDALVAAARRVARLNPEAGEIGDGMLRTIVAEARAALGSRYENDYTLEQPPTD